MDSHASNNDPGGNPASAVAYGYHPAGQIAAVTSVAGVTAYALDAGDRLAAIAAPADTFRYDYNEDYGLISTSTGSALSIKNSCNPHSAVL